MAGQDADDNVKGRMRFGYWVTEATNTLSIFNTYYLSTATVVTRMRLFCYVIHTLPVVFMQIAGFCFSASLVYDKLRDECEGSRRGSGCGLCAIPAYV